MQNVVSISIQLVDFFNKENLNVTSLLYLSVTKLLNDIFLICGVLTHKLYTLLCSCSQRLCSDQGFGEGEGNENEKVRGSNSSGPLNHLTFPFPFPFSYPNP